jgi:hypothetical protein
MDTLGRFIEPGLAKDTIAKPEFRQSIIESIKDLYDIAR